jgi:aspartyl/asparaginyl beta-hydroxylase (cupin superfamily)/Flp pilus assembly protein TadD
MAANESEIRRVVSAAEQARLAGRRDEAMRLLAQAQAMAPEHPLVLNEAGVDKLHAGDASGARPFLERAIEKDGKNPTLWLNLATAFRKLNLPDDEMKALERLLAIEPRHLLALLQKGSLLELKGQPKAAASVFQNALLTIPRGTRLPEGLRPAIDRALSAVRANHAALDAFLADRLRDVRAQHATELQERFDHCIDAFLGKRGIYHPEPTFLQFPKLPAWEFYQREDFPWLDEIEAATADVRSEFERVFVEDAGQLEPYIAYPEGVPIDQWAALNHSRQWSAYYLWRDGARVDEHLARCPKTAELLSRAPLADVPGYAPTAFFSILDAKTHIPAHTGVTNTRLVVHLPLVIPGSCRFRVGSQTREWQAGRAWVFDDTMQHEAWNDSDVPRAILIFDIWNHLMTPAECDLVRTAVQGIRDFYRGEVSITAN